VRIILVEDNKSLAKGIEDALRDQGHGVDHLDDGLAADNFLRTETADVAIIDINLPSLTGIELTKRMRGRGDTTPVLMLTAMGKTSDRVVGLDAGADDYLVKPFEMAELMARLRALTRRRPQLLPEQEQIGDLVYDRQQRVIMHKDRRIDLPGVNSHFSSFCSTTRASSWIESGSSRRFMERARKWRPMRSSSWFQGCAGNSTGRKWKSKRLAALATC
jgi:DNA-binding response OmpR family regulator